MSKFADLLQQTIAESTKPVPKGWFTVRQWAIAEDMPERTVRDSLRLMVEKGKAEVQSFRVTSGQVTRPIPHYRLK